MLCLSNIFARSGLMKQSSSTTMTSYCGEGTGGFLVAGSSLFLSLFCAGSKRWRSLILGPVSGTMKDLNGRDEEQAGRENSGP